MVKLSPGERLLITILSKDRDTFVRGKSTGIPDLGRGKGTSVGFPINIGFRTGLCAFVTFVLSAARGKD